MTSPKIKKESVKAKHPYIKDQHGENILKMQSWLMENHTRSGDLEDTHANDSTMIEGLSPMEQSFAVTPQLVQDHFKT